MEEAAWPRSPSEREHSHRCSSGAVTVGLVVASVLFAGLSVYWLYRIGHTGARAQWQVVQHRIDTGNRVGETGERERGSR